MHEIDLRDRTALITGGTRGIGLAAAVELARAGATIFATYKFGTADLKSVSDQFVSRNLPVPSFVRADVSFEEDTDRLLDEISKAGKKVDIFISNAVFAPPARGLDELKKKHLTRSIEYSSWPLIEYTKKIREKFGTVPRYILGISSDGADRFYPGYDYVAASKALLEVMARYLSGHLIKEDCRVNVLRFGAVKTASSEAFFGDEFFRSLAESVPPERILSPEQCGEAVLAFCSGLLDSINGQVIMIDHGMSFMDNSLARYISSKAEKGETE